MFPVSCVRAVLQKNPVQRDVNCENYLDITKQDLRKYTSNTQKGEILLPFESKATGVFCWRALRDCPAALLS